MFSERLSIVPDALSPRYRLECLLHRGAAACIYLAEDRSLGQRVAVKVLHEEMAATIDADRFRSEFSLLAQLRHPNIVPVYESGEIDGLLYLVMPFIEGETLRTRLSRLGRLPFAEVLSITEDIARALQFAHRHRVVHRDVKPENIILDRDRALVLVVALTGYGQAADVQRAADAGFNAHITKPVAFEELQRVLAEL